MLDLYTHYLLQNINTGDIEYIGKNLTNIQYDPESWDLIRVPCSELNYTLEPTRQYYNFENNTLEVLD